MQILQKEFDNNKVVALLSFVFTAFWMFSAHLYRWGNGLMASHDSLFFDQASHNANMISVGRYLQPIYTIIRGDANAPFLIGLISIAFIALSVFLIVKLFNLNRLAYIVLISAIMSTNATVSLINATYIGWLDIFMFALLCNVLAVWFWKEFPRLVGSLLCITCIFVSLGLYQAFLQISITLFALYLIYQILTSKQFGKSAALEAARFLLCVIVAGLLYYFCSLVVWDVTGITPSSEYNGLADVGDYSGFSLKSIVKLFIGTYCLPFQILVAPETHFVALIGGLNVLILLEIFIGSLYYIVRSRIKRQVAFFVLLLLAALPLAMNFVFLISKGMMHGLMIISYNLFYLLALIIFDLDLRLQSASPAPNVRRGIDKMQDSRVKTTLTCLITGFLLVCFSNIIYSNDAYLKKELEAYSTYSTMTRVIMEIEQQVEYRPGFTEVAFVGIPGKNPYFDIDRSFTVSDFSRLPAWNTLGTIRQTGLTVTSPITYRDNMLNYLECIIGCNINIATKETQNDLEQLDEVIKMPVFPENGCCRFVNDVLVMKLSQ